MNKLMFMGLLMAVSLTGQESQPASRQIVQEQQPIQRIVDVKYADVRNLAELLQGTNMNVRYNEHFRTISLFGRPEAVQNAENIIKKYDVAGPQVRTTNRNIEAVFYLLVASPKGTAGEALPTELESVGKQLTNLFGYRDFRLIDSTVLRGREGTDLNGLGTTTATQGAPVSPYEINVQNTGITASDKGNVIRMDRFRFKVRMPYRTESAGPFQFTEVGFNTNLDVREGQKAVVGKAKFDGSESALVLVVMAKAVE